MDKIELPNPRAALLVRWSPRW